MENINEYQAWTADVWIKNADPMLDITHALLGVTTEVGEVVDLFKKPWFAPQRVGGRTTVDKEELTKEIGDVVYYLSRLAGIMGINMSYVLAVNHEKLEQRYGSSNT